MDRGDPAQLLRQRWVDPDDLAQEIYTILTASRGILRPRRGQTVLSESAEARPDTSSGAAAFQPSPALRSLRLQAAAAASSATTIVGGQANISIAAAPAAIARARSVQPGEHIPLGALAPPVGVSLAGGARIISQRPPPPPPPGTPMSPAQAAVRAVLAQREAQAAAPAITPVAPRRPGLSPSEPSSPPALRDVSQVGARPGVEFGALQPSPPPGPTLNRTDVERLDPAGSGISIDLVTAGQAAFAAEAPAITETPRKPYGDERHIPRLTRIPMQSFSNILVQLDVYGLPQMVSNAGVGGGLPMTPGKGHGIILDFDGATLEAFDSDPIEVFNLSLLPVGGSTFTRCRLFGHWWFAEPATFSHAIVSSAISACAGVVPGTGQATPYYMVGGTMTIGPAVVTENWYAITAAVGKHCGLVCVDGRVSLEVLDC